MPPSEDSFTPMPGATYRFVVKSAEEAVQLIHEKLGPNARVISVKQTGAKGLAGLLRSPQLEVIAEVGDVPPATKPLPAPSPNPAATPAPAPAPAAPATFSLPPSAFPEDDLPLVAPETELPATSGLSAEEISWLDLPATTTPSATPPAATPAAQAFFTPPASRPPSESLERLLARAGFSEQLLERWRRLPHWSQLRSRPLGESLKEVVEMLRQQWNEQPQRPLSNRVAFFGPPGSGATTALCKALTMDVFFRQQPAVVMKLDGDQPNPTEGLAMFCEALDVTLLRSTDELDSISSDERIYIDTAGAPLRDQAAWRDLGRLFSEFYVETRVLVLNAAYDLDILKRAYTLGREAGATHVVFTHLDEVVHWGKLWDLLLSGGLQPLFFSSGQNVAGDASEDTFELMVLRMFGGQKL